MPAMAARALRPRVQGVGYIPKLNHLGHATSTVECSPHVRGIAFAQVGSSHAVGCNSLITTSRIVKYSGPVHIVTRKHLWQAMKGYSDAANEIKAWTAIVQAVRWHSFNDVLGMFKDADSVDGYVIFNIRRNRYPL